MNRQFKFRAWDKQAHDWNKANGEESFPLNEMIGWEELRDYEMDVLDSGGGGLVIMQFTGLKDENGKDIYEADIVTTGTGKAMVVTWNNKFASFCLSREGWAFRHWFGEACNPQDCAVVGNLYQNPDLLESEAPNE